MRREDLPTLAERLGQLAEAFERKSPTPGAMLVWLDALKEFPLHEVESMLVDMPKRLTKFPAPADVWKACNERRSERIENAARLHAKEQPIRVAHLQADSFIARREMAKIKAILAKPRPSKRAWIEAVFKRHEDADETLSGYALKLAQEASRSLHVVREA